MDFPGGTSKDIFHRTNVAYKCVIRRREVSLVGSFADVKTK